SYEAIAVRFDASGGLVWNRVIPDSRSRIIAVERTSSGGYVELQAFVSGGYAARFVTRQAHWAPPWI
ncbi:MAG: hypothetical protein ACI80K_004130, partial [Paracoccaceae bacterium]